MLQQFLSLLLEQHADILKPAPRESKTNMPELGRKRYSLPFYGPLFASALRPIHCPSTMFYSSVFSWPLFGGLLFLSRTAYWSPP